MSAIIQQTNSRVWGAIAVIRFFGRNAGKGELYDALNARRRARDIKPNPRISQKIDRDIRTWGRQERTLGEILSCLKGAA